MNFSNISDFSKLVKVLKGCYILFCFTVIEVFCKDSDNLKVEYFIYLFLRITDKLNFNCEIIFKKMIS